MKLPRVMEITDNLGNDWKIIQDSKRKRSKKSMDKVTGKEIQISKELDEKHESVLDNKGGGVVGMSSIPNSENDNEKLLHDYKMNQTQSIHVRLPILHPHKKDSVTTDNETSDQTSSMEKKNLLSKYNTLVRSGKISYIEYLKLMSDIAPNIRFYDPKEKMERQNKPTIHGKDDTTTETANKDLQSREVPLESMADTRSNHCSVGTSSLPPELENLYSRANRNCLTTKNLSLAGRLPLDFLQKDRKEIRLVYPMFDSILQSKTSFQKQMLIQKKIPSDDLQTDSNLKQFKLPLEPINTKEVNAGHAIKKTGRDGSIEEGESLAKVETIIFPNSNHIKQLSTVRVSSHTRTASKSVQNKSPKKGLEIKCTKVNLETNDSLLLGNKEDNPVISRPLQADASDEVIVNKTKYPEREEKHVTWNDDLIYESPDFMVPHPPPVTMEYCSNHSGISGLDNLSDNGDNNLYDEGNETVNSQPGLVPSVQTLQLSTASRNNQHMPLKYPVHVSDQKIKAVRNLNGVSLSTLNKHDKPKISTHSVVFVSPLKNKALNKNQLS